MARNIVISGIRCGVISTIFASNPCKNKKGNKPSPPPPKKKKLAKKAIGLPKKINCFYSWRELFPQLGNCNQWGAPGLGSGTAALFNLHK